MSQKFTHASVNGEIIALAEAQVSLAHPVFTSSFGVYESIQVDQGRPFHLEDHIERLEASAGLIGIPLPPLDSLIEWGKNLVSALHPASYSIQILAIGDVAFKRETIVAFTPKAIRRYPKTFYANGVGAISYQGERALPQCKSFNTLVNYLARAEAQQRGALEGLLVHNNEIYEGARSNIFVVEAAGQQLLTPPASKVLSGITRDIVLEVMEESPYPVQERDILLDTTFSEIFLSSTSMHVMPITMLDGQKIGDGRVGPVTKEAMKRFSQYYTKYFEDKPT